MTLIIKTKNPLVFIFSQLLTIFIIKNTIKKINKTSLIFFITSTGIIVTQTIYIIYSQGNKLIITYCCELLPALARRLPNMKIKFKKL